MSQISRELHLMLQASVREALARRHAYVTVEHLLFAMVHDAQGSDILRHAGADLLDFCDACRRPAAQGRCALREAKHGSAALQKGRARQKPQH